MGSPLATLIEHAAAAKVGGVFDVSELDDKGRAAVDLMVRRSTFKFSRVHARIAVRYEKFGQRKSVHRHPEVADDRSGSTTKVIAQAQRHPPAILLSGDLQSARFSVEQLATIIMEELAHHVDWHLLTAEKRKAIFAAYHGGEGKPHSGHSWLGKSDYWAQVGESFMAGFVMAYSDFKPDQAGLKHRTTPAVAREIRRIIG